MPDCNMLSGFSNTAFILLGQTCLTGHSINHKANMYVNNKWLPQTLGPFPRPQKSTPTQCCSLSLVGFSLPSHSAFSQTLKRCFDSLLLLTSVSSLSLPLLHLLSLGAFNFLCAN